MSRRRTLRSGLLLSAGALVLAISSPCLQAQGYLVEWAYPFHVNNLPGANYIDFAVGTAHVVALRHDGYLVSSGYPNSPEVANTPTDGGYTQVSAGLAHSLALRRDGSIAAWGINNGSSYDYGQVTNTPTGTGFVQVDCSEFTSLALRADGSLIAWGLDLNGHVSSAPSGTGFVQITAGPNQAMALRADGSIVSWGWDGIGFVTNTPTGTGFTQVEAGPTSSMALRSDGSIIAWGTGNNVTINAPTDVGYTFIASGGVNHGIALRADGSIHSWGADSAQLLSLSPAGSGFTKVAGGYNVALALKGGDSGSPFCVGDGTGAPCPCLNNGQLDEGCANSTGSHGARLTGAGTPQLTADTFSLEVVGAPPGRPGVILRASGQFNAGLGNPVGGGLFCIGGQVDRSQVQFSSGGVSTFSDFNGSPFWLSSQGAGVPTHYQFFYRDSSTQCSGSGFNFSNAWTVVWKP